MVTTTCSLAHVNFLAVILEPQNHKLVSDIRLNYPCFFFHDLQMGNVLNRAEKDTCRQKDPKWKILSATAYLISILFLFYFFFSLNPNSSTTSSEFWALPRQFKLQNRCLSRKCLEAISSPGSRVQLCSASRSRQPTAVMRAAPLPLPSSESRNVTSHLGARSFTVWCMTFEKLQKAEKG